MQESENIQYFLDKDETFREMNIRDFMDEFNNMHMMNEFNNNELGDIYATITDYDLNYNTKQLLRICEFYGLTKKVKMSKSKKLDIISSIIVFENEPDNFDIVYKRRQLWNYINELKNNKYMKQFVIW
jgi:hypothetical protein